MVVSDNGESLVISMLKELSGDWIFFGAKPKDLTMLVRPNNDGVGVLLPFWRLCFGEAILESRCHYTGDVIVEILNHMNTEHPSLA